MIKKVLAIAGSDSSGGAGIQTDIKTYSALGIYGMTAITSITAQNTLGVTMIEDISGKCVYEQIKACLEDVGADAIKVGMLSNSDIIKNVEKSFIEFMPKNIVLDPVMVTTTGHMLLKDDAKNSLMKLIKYATIITPNKSEAEVMTNIKIFSRDDARRAAYKLKEYTDAVILIKGVEKAVDLLFINNKVEFLEGRWVDNTNSHGTGCTLSSAIASFLAKGYDIKTAVKKAKEFITEAIEQGLSVGSGSGPTNPLYKVWKVMGY